MSNEKNTGGPAFPRQLSRDDAYGRTYDYDTQEGMTLRDYFAAKVMAGLCVTTGIDFGGLERAAKTAYAIADAMLKARNS